MFSFVLTTLLACGPQAEEQTTTDSTKPAAAPAKETAKPEGWAEVHKANVKPVEKQASAPKTEPSTDTGSLPKGYVIDQETLNNPTAPAASPEQYEVMVSTTKGDFLLEVTRSWSPNGADRFYQLVSAGYYTDIAFFRAIDNFMVQFGMHGTPALTQKWQKATIEDDPSAGKSNTTGMVTFAKTGAPNSRSTQLFISDKNNSFLDRMGFTPIGKIVEGKGGGMDVVNALHTGYGETPSQGRIVAQGNTYLRLNFPKLDYIIFARVCGQGSVEVVPEWCP